MTVPQIVRKHTDMGFKEAVKYYASLNLSRAKVAECIGISRPAMFIWLKRYPELNSYFPKRQRDMAPDCKGGANGNPGPNLKLRKPIEHNGVVWYPGESTHHFLFYRRSDGKG